MDRYIGTKIIFAKPMRHDQFLAKYRTEESKSKEIRLQEVEGYVVKYSDDYFSWSPKSMFESAYKKCEAMTFGLALEALKKGFKVSRKNWAGKNMFIVFQKGYPQGIACNKQTAEAWGLKEGDLFLVKPYLQIRLSDGSHSMWTPSVDDCLANDWLILE